MQIGTQRTFAIECFHEPIANSGGRVYGRMCLWVGDAPLGDISEGQCWLDALDGWLRDVLERVEALTDPAVDDLNDEDAFTFLDKALYLDSDAWTPEISDRFGRFDFLTNAGESFDRTKSFILRSDTVVRILFRNTEGLHSGRVPVEDFIRVCDAFLAWVEEERRRVPSAAG